MAVMAVLLQLADKPDPSKEEAMKLLRTYRPDAAYVGAGVLGTTLSYVGGVTWQTGSRYGLGAEYRYYDESVTFIGNPHDLVTHTGGLYLYRDLAAVGSLRLRTDLGAGLIFTESDTLRLSETWALSARAVGLLNIAEGINLMMYFAGVQAGSFDASDARHRARITPEAYPETGILLAIDF